MSIRGLDVALQALSAQQQAIDVLNHNIANANTPGYSRQRINLLASPPYTVPTFADGQSKSQVGNGVQVGSIERLRDSFLDAQVRAETRSLGQAQVEQQTFDRLQAIFQEPSTTGLAARLNQFWASWQDLSATPGDRPARATLIQQTLGLTGLINQSYSRLVALRSDVAQLAALKVADINSATAQIAVLNGQIQQAQLNGARANDLLDRRDALLDNLATKLKFSTVVNGDDTVSLFAGGQEMVNRTNARTLATSTDSGGDLHVHWGDTGTDLNPGGGELQGAMDAANTLIPNQLAALDTLALQLRDEVNAIHTTGFDLSGNSGGDFFTGAGARDITVSGSIQADPGALAAAGQPSAPGDGSVALAIAQLQHDGAIDDGYRQLIASLGIAARSNDDTVTNQRTLVDSLQQRRDAVSGVSLDEEAANLVKYQRAYQAAARVITATDEMLNTLINATGIVGRS